MDRRTVRSRENQSIGKVDRIQTNACPPKNESSSRLLHNTSYFIQSIFWYLRIVLAVCITIPIEIIHTILAGLFKPVLLRLPIIVSDTLIKPFYAALFNTLMYVY